MTSVAIYPDGTTVSGSVDKTVSVWNKDTGDCIRVLEGHTYVSTMMGIVSSSN